MKNHNQTPGVNGVKNKNFRDDKRSSQKNEINKGVKAWGSFSTDSPVCSSFTIRLSDSDNIHL